MIEPAPRAIPDGTRVVIVGAGRAGLAMAFSLLRKGMRPQRDFVLIDESDAGTTFGREAARTPTVRQAALPGIRPAGKKYDPMSVEEIVNYLDSYASQLGLMPVWGTRICALHVDPSGHGLRLMTDRGDITTRYVIVTVDPPNERTSDGCHCISQLNPDHAERQIPGIFAITGVSTDRRGLYARTARVARAIATTKRRRRRPTLGLTLWATR
ncbi:hypothetical protein BH10ACT7_BH10ACT7_20850 [soil metagenome]